MIERVAVKILEFKDVVNRFYPFIFTILFLAIIFQYSFSGIEAVFYDLRVKYDLFNPFEDNIVLITLDEESDQFLGETFPYSYSAHKRIMKKLGEDRPLVISFLVQLNEPLADRELNNLNEFKNEINSYLKKGGRFRFGTELDKWGEKLPPKKLRDFGHSTAIINVDNAKFAKDDVSRRALINISGEETLHSWIANKYRKKMGEKELNAGEYFGSYYDSEADATFSLFKYYSTPIRDKGRIKQIPFHRVLVGNFPKNFFKDKIVLIGPSYITRADDFLLTPFEKNSYYSSKLAVHANIIQALINEKTVLSLPEWVSYALSLIIAVLLSFAISKIPPTRGLILTLGLIVGIFITSFLLFSILGIWIYMIHLLLTVLVVYYIWVPFRAIAEYQRRYAIQEETVILKKVENLKQNFISLMSHDLKTPVAKIAGLTDIMLKKNGQDSAIGIDLKKVQDATVELDKFISSILDLTKVESGQFALNVAAKDVNKIMEKVIEGLKFEAGQKGIKIETQFAPLYPINVDPILVKRVFHNLVENAIKYCERGAVVSVNTWDDDSWVYVDIVDTGPGIPAAELEYIFEKFYRVKNDASHSVRGSGLGLYLVKYFIEMQGGSIEATSEVGKGTNFRVKFVNR